MINYIQNTGKEAEIHLALLDKRKDTEINIKEDVGLEQVKLQTAMSDIVVWRQMVEAS